MLRLLTIWILSLALSLPAAAKDAQVYFFGNSLVNHLEGGDETAVPYWLSKMAQAAGNRFAADGQWGFPRDFIRPGAPLANWSFGGVRGAWNPDRRSFAAADFTAIVVNPSNFVQYQPPSAPYDGENEGGVSPLGALAKLVDMHVGKRRLILYEGWADMGVLSPVFPPDADALARYHEYNTGAYHDWYVDLAAELKTEKPEAKIELVPVARVLSRLMLEPPFDGLGADIFYVDSAPHGTPTTYLLAAMVLYPALYGEAPPEKMSLPESIAPELRENFAQIGARIMTLLDDTEDIENARQPEPVEAPSEAAFAGLTEPPKSKGRQLGNPSLAVGLAGISDWSTQHPFINVMKTARPWVGHVNGQWGAVQMKDLEEGGYLDKNGYPTRLPEHVERLESFVLTDQPKVAQERAGRYRIRWKGEGKLVVSGRGQTERMAQSKNERWLNYTPGDGLVSIAIKSTDPQRNGNYIRDIEIVREDHIALHELGVVFNPAWRAVIEDMRSLRFMDWMLTNGSPVKSWAGRPAPDAFSYGWRGVPLEVMIALSNEVGADPWFCMPHAADDAYVAGFAEMVRRDLDPRLKVFVEYSNELWNHVFPQAHYASEQSASRWNGAQGDAWMQFAGMRAAEVMALWSEVFGAEAAERLVRVMAVHTGWMGLEEPFMEAPLALAEGKSPPKESFDAYAVTGYFGFDIGLEEEGLPKVRRAIAKSRGRVEKAARAEGLRRKALEVAIAPVKFDEAYPQVAEMLQEGSFKELTEVLWPYHAGVAEQHGMQLVMYEGGSHVTPHGNAINEDELVEFFTRFNYTPEMAALYDTLLAKWREVGGSLFNAFVDVAPASKFGSWGHLRHLQDSNPRWEALMRGNAVSINAPKRAEGTFAQGVLRVGSEVSARLVGTSEEDVFLGGAGDEVFISAGGTDRIDGGAGNDRAELPGRASEYKLRREGGRVLAVRDRVEVILKNVEVLYFDEEPTKKYRLTAE